MPSKKARAADWHHRERASYEVQLKSINNDRNNSEASEYQEPGQKA
jgi:hypothetical protein